MIIFKIGELMAKKKLNKKDVSDITGIRPNTVSALWHGTSKRIEIDQIDSLCQLFDCQPGDLFSYVPDDKQK